MAYSVEELLAMGLDLESAQAMTKMAGTTSAGANPFQKISMNYSDIITDNAGIKKGNFLYGFKEDKKTLSIKEEGVDLGPSISFYIISSVFQVSHFDITTNSNVFQTPIFFSAYETKTMKDKKTGVTVAEWKASGKKATFDNILLVMIKTDDGYKPFTIYVHGTNYHSWCSQLEKLGKDTGFKNLFTVKSVKVATDFQPAWCMDIQTVVEREATDIMSGVKDMADAVKQFNTWIQTSNARGSSSTEPATVANRATAAEEIDEDDIQF